MGLQEKLATRETAPKLKVSRVETWLESLSDDDRKAAQAALGDRNYTTSALLAIFTEEGLTGIGESALAHHRRNHYYNREV